MYSQEICYDEKCHEIATPVQQDSCVQYEYTAKTPYDQKSYSKDKTPNKKTPRNKTSDGCMDT